MENIQSSVRESCQSDLSNDIRGILRDVSRTRTIERSFLLLHAVLPQSWWLCHASITATPRHLAHNASNLRSLKEAGRRMTVLQGEASTRSGHRQARQHEV